MRAGKVHRFYRNPAGAFIFWRSYNNRNEFRGYDVVRPPRQTGYMIVD